MIFFLFLNLLLSQFQICLIITNIWNHQDSKYKYACLTRTSFWSPVKGLEVHDATPKVWGSKNEASGSLGTSRISVTEQHPESTLVGMVGMVGMVGGSRCRFPGSDPAAPIAPEAGISIVDHEIITLLRSFGRARSWLSSQAGRLG